MNQTRVSKKPNCRKRASSLGEWPPPICNSSVTQRVGGKDRSMSSLEEARGPFNWCKITFSLNGRDLGRRSPLCFWCNTLTVCPKIGLIIKTQMNFYKGNRKTWKTRVQKALRRVHILQDWIKEKKALPDVSKLIRITFSLGILQRYSSGLSMIYCSENTFKTSIVSFPYLHSITGPSWVLPLYKHLMTLYCGWKLRIFSSELHNLSDPLKTLLWEFSSRSLIYLAALTWNDSRTFMYFLRVDSICAASTSTIWE